MGGTLKVSTPDFSRFETKRGVGGSTDSDSQSIRTLPLSKIPESDAPVTDDGKSTGKDGKDATNHNGTDVVRHLQDQAKDNSDATSKMPASPQASQRPVTSSGWLGGWWGKPQDPGKTTSEENKPASEPVQDTEMAPGYNDQAPPGEMTPAPPETPKPDGHNNSWFGSWWSTPATDAASKKPTETPFAEATTAKDGEDVIMQDAPPDVSTEANQPSAGSTWAFWSRDTSSKSTGKSTKAQEQGELAVIGDGSEASPRRLSGVQVKGGPTQLKESPLKKGPKESLPQMSPSKKNKRVRPQSIDLDEPSSGRPNTPPNTKNSHVKPETPGSAKTLPTNLLLPSFRDTYHMKQNPSIVRQIAQLLLRTQQPPAKHVHLVRDPPKIKKAIAIGVHGLFPATYLRPMIGQPTGTSIRFVNHCAEAIRRWAENHGCGDCEIEKVALEGEGKIAERVDNLWKLLLNWIEHLRSADLIVLACHSQGVPVGLMLVAKLIDLGIITTARIGVCGMAGVSLGPFPDYKSGLGVLMGSAAELWQFADPESEISKRLEHALQVVLEHGARVTYVGSIDDQLVPMESAIYSPASHPYIYRAVFIDGRIHAPDFIAHLVGFALKLRNLGISDQGLIRELSVALAGSLYSGEGHSRLYDDERVYDLAVSHALETTIEKNASCRIEKFEGLANPNPYVLPWIMRGLLEEDFVKTELSAETAQLLKQFDDWKPVTKALKDIKFRLEAVRSKL